MLDSITKEDGYLVKVKAASDSQEKDKYYYIGNVNTLNQLRCCPVTRRDGMYFIIKLSTLNESEISALTEPTDEKTLIDDNQKLEKIFADAKWEGKWIARKFPKKVSYQATTTPEDLALFDDDGQNNNEVTIPPGYDTFINSMAFQMIQQQLASHTYTTLLSAANFNNIDFSPATLHPAQLHNVNFSVPSFTSVNTSTTANIRQPQVLDLNPVPGNNSSPSIPTGRTYLAYNEREVEVNFGQIFGMFEHTPHNNIHQSPTQTLNSTDEDDIDTMIDRYNTQNGID